MSKVNSKAISAAMAINVANAKAAQHMPIATPQAVASSSAANNHMSVIRLSVHQVRAYEGNPRTVDNDEALNIKESIRAAGLNQRLTITKRPNQDFHILSNGGRTRLTALQQLAQENPQKFEMQDFMLEPYISEERLLAAHMIENHVRSKNMVLWDTAVGFLNLKALLATELGRDPSSNEFEKRLKENGLTANSDQLQRYEFVCQRYAALNERCRAQLNFRGVKDVLQPALNLLQTFWVKHPEKNEIGFKDAYLNAVTLYVPPESKDTKFSAHDLQQHINRHFAQLLSYELGQMEQMLAVIKGDANIQITDLLLPALSLAQQENLTNVGEDIGSAQESSTGVGGNTTNARIAEQGLQHLAGVMTGGRQTGSTLRVAQSSELLPPRSASNNVVPGAASSAQQTDELPGLSELEVATESFQQAVMVLAQEAGVYSYMRFTATSLPYGFYLEVPEDDKQVGDQPDDIAVQAWWYLNCVSGVFLEIDGNPDCLPTESILRQSYSEYATGGRVELWQQIVNQQLGGAVQIDAASMLGVITGGYTFRELALEVLDALYVLNSYLLANQQQGEGA